MIHIIIGIRDKSTPKQFKNGLFRRVFTKITAKFPKKRCWSYIDTLVSGSPILQNDKLIGAVTHVLVDDPTKGYAIFAENMLETAQQVAKQRQALTTS